MMITTLDVRESINIFVVIFTTVILFLYISYIFHNWVVACKSVGVSPLSNPRNWLPCLRIWYQALDDATRLAIGWVWVVSGELLRAAIIWSILHNNRETANYATDIIPLLVALVMIVTGSACVIRVLSPKGWGHGLWLIAFVLAVAISLFAI